MQGLDPYPDLIRYLLGRDDIVDQQGAGHDESDDRGRARGIDEDMHDPAEGR